MHNECMGLIWGYTEVLPHILSSLRLQNSYSNFQEIQESTSILWARNLRYIDHFTSILGFLKAHVQVE